MADWLTHEDSITQSMAIAAALLRHYSFDMAGKTIGEMITTWAQDYPALWLRAAVIEALYQGRYKAVSVQQILTIWQRRSRPLCHFNGEFERIVSSPILEGYTLDSVTEELAAIAEQVNLIDTLHTLPSSEAEHSQTHEAGLSSTQELLSPDSPPIHHGSIPPLRPFAHQPQSAPSSDRSTGSYGRAIDQFVPEPNSEFCQRLQAIATPNPADAEQATTFPHSDAAHSPPASGLTQPASTDSLGSPSSIPHSPDLETTKLNEWTEDDHNEMSTDSTLDADLKRLLNAGPETRD